jgi:hypothetical protein
MIQLARSGLVVDAGDAELASIADEFASRHVVRLPAFTAPDLLRLLVTRLRESAFRPRIEDGIEVEETLEDADLSALCHFLLNDPRLLEVVERITRSGPLTDFLGRVYRRRAARTPGEHYYDWHNDLIEGRRIGLSLNLSHGRYEGGSLQLRDKASHTVFADMANPNPGDAVLFRVSAALEHRVLPVIGGVARTTLAGWFRANSGLK